MLECTEFKNNVRNTETKDYLFSKVKKIKLERK